MLTRKTVVLLGQGLNLKSSGGAGRYAAQLYKKLVDQDENELSDLDSVFSRFRVEDQKEGVQPFYTQKKKIVERNRFSRLSTFYLKISRL